MKQILIVVVVCLLIFSMAAVSSAAPFLVADPQPGDAVQWYRVTIAATGESFTTDYGNQHPSGAMIVFDFAEHAFPPGEVALEVQAVNIAGDSIAAPFVFTMPSAVPQSPTNGGLAP
mgnify:CR=1 FL=1